MAGRREALTAFAGDTERVRVAVEEFLRFESSTNSATGSRHAKRSSAASSLPADARITLCIGAANRDPAQFFDPDRLDLARDPNRHIAFGSGIHTCAGMNLARLEGRVALSRFLARFPGYRLHGDPVRGGRARFRGFPAFAGARRVDPPEGAKLPRRLW